MRSPHILLAFALLVCPWIQHSAQAAPLQVEVPVPVLDPEQKPAPKPGEPAKTFRDLTPPQAWDASALEGKMSVVIALSASEADSKRFESQTLASKEVRDWLSKNSVAVKIYKLSGKQKNWITKQSLSSFPTVVMRAPDMRLLETMIGFQDPKEFLHLLKNMQRAIAVTEKPTGAAAKDPYTWLAYANYTAGRGMQPDKTAEALFWCYDNGNKYDPTFLDQNLNFLLRRMTHVSHYSETVKEGVRTRRDRLHNKVMLCEASDFEAYTLSRFGIWMRDRDDPMRAFLSIPRDKERSKALREVLLWNNLEHLIAYRHYDDILATIPDPKMAIASRLVAIDILNNKDKPTQLDVDMPRPPGVGTQPNPAEPASEDQASAEAQAPKLPKVAPERAIPGVSLDLEDACYDAALLYEALVSRARGKEARELMEMTTGFSPTTKAFGFFIEKACRAEKWDLAESIADRAMLMVPEREIPLIQARLRRNMRRPK